MLRSKHIERICCIVMACALLLTGGVLAAVQAGAIRISHAMGYEDRLFDQSQVHTIDIVMEDWESFIDTCENEEYAACALVIDGEAYKNVAIRAKGNTSLSSVAEYGNDRYSFKVEFDHYDNSITYHGLDKLSLNNLIQDATCMKDYLAYTLMNKMGVAAPLCSYVQINVNGEAWGLYLAVEGVEDSFLARNYGSDTGELYKPDSMSFGGGRGNGRGFDMADFSFDGEEAPAMPQKPGGILPGEGERGQRRDFSDGMKQRGGMGASDVKLQYTDDDPASYSNIFSNAKTDVTEADQARLIASLKRLGEGDTSVVDTDQVMRYLAVHHFLCNDDSYTGQMVHNYYLRETDGVLSLISWDYNLSFGGFSGGRGAGGATDAVNSPIDDPVSSGEKADRPMVAWIWNSQETTDAYHAIYQEFMDTVFNSGWFAAEVDRVAAMIAPYVQNDPTAFFTYEEHQQGIATLKAFCEKRVQSLNGQLAGTIPTTSAGQRASDALIDASEINLSDMGGMNKGGGFGGGMPSMPGGFEMPQGMEPPEGFAMPGFGAPAGEGGAPLEAQPAMPLEPANFADRRSNGEGTPAVEPLPQANAWLPLAVGAAAMLLGFLFISRWKGRI